MVSRRTVLLASGSAALGLVTGCGSTRAPSPPPGTTAASAPTSVPVATSASPTLAPPTTSRSSDPSSPAPRRTPRPATPGPPDPKVSRVIAADLDVPWGIVFLASGAALFSERDTGRIRRIAPDGKISTLGHVAGVAAPDGLGEGGLLGLALAPGDQNTLYAYLTSRSDNRVVRFSIAGGRVGKPKAVLTGIPTSTHHHGGQLLFDRAGLLYVTTGDAEQSALAQNKTSPAGKILRIRPDGRAAPGNPFGNRIWSYGHRNIEGLAFDAQGRLWATEFGDKRSDELNLIVKGRNYGWPVVEGRSSNPRFAAPKATWSPTSSCSPAGLAITRSTAFVGALQGRCLFSVPLRGTSAGSPKAHFRGDYGRIRGVTVAPDGALWMTTSNTDGRVDPGRHDDKIIRVSL